MAGISDINSKLNKCYWNSSGDVELNLVVHLDFETIETTVCVFGLGFLYAEKLLCIPICGEFGSLHFLVNRQKNGASVADAFWFLKVNFENKTW